MQVVQFIYNETNIDFSVNGNVMVNATQMAKVFNKQVNEFTSNKNTIQFVETCLKNGNSRFLGIEKESDLINSKQKSGTWMHRVLALKFAAWLDPEFELWVYSRIDKILLGSFQKVKEAMIEQATAKSRWEKKRNELIEKNPEVAELFAEELKMTKAERKRVKAMNEIKQGIVLTGFGFDPV